MLSGLRGQEWLIILFIILLLFGAKKLPEMARGLGRSVRILKAESKAAQAEPENEEKSEKDETKKEEA
ncbi:MAG: Sec-independent protein translocase subunit TatA [Candidatus Nanopelagicales bacterium]